MRTADRVITLAMFLIIFAGCAPIQHYRSKTVTPDGAALRDEICNLEVWRHEPERCRDYALEHRHYRAGLGDQSNDYYLSFVEFDDQGWFWDRKQMEILLRRLEKEGAVQDLLIVVYAHGWRHNASACDDNVICFTRLLERLDLIERRLSGKEARKVFGVYVGWRGLSATLQPFEWLSFWERKNSADRVGLGGVTELLSRLNHFRRNLNPRRQGEGTHLIITGHSFGGQVIFSALSNNLIERAVRTEIDRATNSVRYGTATSFGDLVVLVNPAFEGSKYEALRHAATNRCYSEKQRPVLLVVTSKADSATRLAFPAGRALSTLLEASRPDDATQKSTVRNTVGHLDRYITHELHLLKEKSKPAAAAGERPSCGCPYLDSTDRFAERFLDGMGAEQSFLESLDRETKTLGEEKEAIQESYTSPELGKDSIYYGSELELRRYSEFGDYASNYPYFVVSTNDRLIPSHNEIYGEDFTNFVRRFYIRHIMQKITFPANQCFAAPPDECRATDIELCRRSFQLRPR